MKGETMHATAEIDYYENQVNLLNVSIEEYLEKASSLVEENQVTPLERTTLKFQASLLVCQRLQAEMLLEVLKAQNRTP